ncbi:MAG: YidC/Oxa1 family membrane protein insertase [Limnochordia bacterium]|nr:YidC/Oxa1 family membrane protein insertase [Limnochordia bacterium]MDD2630439.1 YidC/Oxa1 family membrane protein insertase [Limnochordia bacterium]MDD4517876.1 YidC/Oxa1 family membrane protein insertase [Limnochordia bacterium]
MQYLQQGLEWVLTFFYQLTGNWGLAIVFLTVLFRIVLYPLYLSQMRSLAASKRLQPHLEELQKKYKDNPEELNRRMMQLYQENKVNPFGGCLPALLQLPIIWILFSVLRNFEFEGGFLWIPNLKNPDPFYILPILAAVFTYGQSKMMNTGTETSGSANSMNQVLTWFSPILIGSVSIRFPSGVVIYWTVNSILAMIQQHFVQKQLDAEEKERGAAGNEGDGKKRQNS